MWCFRIRISMHACLNKDVCDRSAVHRAPWQDLELILRPLLLHRNRCTRREREAYASLRPSETFMHMYLSETLESCMFPCMKMHEQSSADCGRHSKVCTTRIHTDTACFRVMHTRKTPCALLTYKHILIGVFFIHGNGNTHVCLSRWWNLFYFNGCHLKTIVAN